MDRLFITGDTHGTIDIEKLTYRKFPIQSELYRSDVMVILGDSALCWDGDGTDRWLQNWYKEKKFSTLSVRGNHDNPDLIAKLPLEPRYGGMVYSISPNVCYAATGEIYTLSGFKCLCVNGADSHDIAFRKEGESWWRGETITKEQYEKCMKNLEKHNFKVDFVFSHTGGLQVNAFLGFNETQSDKYLDKILEQLTYTYQYCGHYHVDEWVNSKTRILYNDIIELTNWESTEW